MTTKVLLFTVFLIFAIASVLEALPNPGHAIGFSNSNLYGSGFGHGLGFNSFGNRFGGGFGHGFSGGFGHGFGGGFGHGFRRGFGHGFGGGFGHGFGGGFGHGFGGGFGHGFGGGFGHRRFIGSSFGGHGFYG